MTDVTIRRATAADLPSIARLHSASWNSAYRTMLPASFLSGVEARHRSQWSTMPADGFVLVAEPAADADSRAGQQPIVAFASLLPGEADHGDVLLDNLHTEPELRSTGIGAAVLDAVLNTAAANGATRLYLWVFEENVRAREFYGRHGGTEGPTRVERFDDGTAIIERRITWDLPRH